MTRECSRQPIRKTGGIRSLRLGAGMTGLGCFMCRFPWVAGLGSAINVNGLGGYGQYLVQAAPTDSPRPFINISTLGAAPPVFHQDGP